MSGLERRPRRAETRQRGTGPRADWSKLIARGVAAALQSIGPRIEARRVLEGMKPGEVLKLVSNCPATRDEVRTWATATRVSLVEMHEMGGGAWEFFLKRG